MTRMVGTTNQASVFSDTRAGLNLLTDSGKTLNATELKKLGTQQTADEQTLKTLEARLGKTKNPKTQAALQARINALKPKIAGRTEQIATLSNPNYAGDRIRGAFSEQYGMRDNIVSRLGASLTPTSEYGRMQDALGRGITAQTANTSQASAAGIGQVADVRAREVGAGALGNRLMGEALRRVDLNGRLSAQDERDVSQVTRAGMAARGMATGSAGLGAELLNRDRFSRQRAFQDLGFAQGIQDQDIGRQFNNVGNVLRADQGNQQTQFGREQVISGNQQQANLANMQASNNMAQFNAGQTDSANRFNMGLLGTSAQMADQERLRQTNTATDQYNFAQATDPRMTAMGLGQQFSNLTGSTQGGLNVASFNQNMQSSMYNSMMNNNAATQAANMQAGAASQAGMMGMIGSGVGAAAGIGAGVLFL